MSCDVGKATEWLENELWCRWSDGKVGGWTLLCVWALLILQPFRHFTYVTTHSPTLISLYLRHSSFSNPSVVSPTSQLILQPLFRFTYVTAHSPTVPLLHLHHSSFSNPSFALPTSQLILQPFRCFTYVSAHSPTLLSPLLRHRFSLTSPGEPPWHWHCWSPPDRIIIYAPGKRALWARALSWCSFQTLFFQRFGRFFRKACHTVSLLIPTMSAINLTLRRRTLRTISLIFWIFWSVFKLKDWPGLLITFHFFPTLTNFFCATQTHVKVTLNYRNTHPLII